MMKSLFLICLASLISLVAGAVGGTYYMSRDINAAYGLGLSAALIRQDTVLQMLEKNDVATATSTLRKQLESSVFEVKSGNVALTKQAEQIVTRRSLSTKWALTKQESQAMQYEIGTT